MRKRPTVYEKDDEISRQASACFVHSASTGRRRQGKASVLSFVVPPLGGRARGRLKLKPELQTAGKKGYGPHHARLTFAPPRTKLALVL
jgi:hypothetical protein